MTVFRIEQRILDHLRTKEIDYTVISAMTGPGKGFLKLGLLKAKSRRLGRKLTD